MQTLPWSLSLQAVTWATCMRLLSAELTHSHVSVVGASSEMHGQQFRPSLTIRVDTHILSCLWCHGVRSATCPQARCPAQAEMSSCPAGLYSEDLFWKERQHKISALWKSNVHSPLIHHVVSCLLHRELPARASCPPPSSRSQLPVTLYTSAQSAETTVSSVRVTGPVSQAHGTCSNDAALLNISFP